MTLYKMLHTYTVSVYYGTIGAVITFLKLHTVFIRLIYVHRVLFGFGRKIKENCVILHMKIMRWF